MVQGVIIDETTNCIINTNPATGEIISHVKCTTEDELNDMITKAKNVQSRWAFDVTLEERINLLKKCLQHIKSNYYDTLVTMIVKEMGKPIREAKIEMDCATSKEDTDENGYLNILHDSLKPQTYNNSTIVRHPLGIVGILSPWNFPVDEILLLALPSLASGNTGTYTSVKL